MVACIFSFIEMPIPLEVKPVSVSKERKFSKAYWYHLVISTLGRVGQGNCKLEASLGYIVSSSIA